MHTVDLWTALNPWMSIPLAWGAVSALASVVSGSSALRLLIKGDVLLVSLALLASPRVSQDFREGGPLPLASGISGLGMFVVSSSTVTWFGLVCVFSGLNPHARSWKELRILIRPQLALASGSRRWPQLVIPTEWPTARNLIGYPLILLTGVLAGGISLVYFGLHSIGDGKQVLAAATLLALAQVLVRTLCRLGKWGTVRAQVLLKGNRQPRLVPLRVCFGGLERLIDIGLVLSLSLFDWLQLDLAGSAGQYLLRSFLLAMLLGAAVCVAALHRLGQRFLVIHALEKLKKDQRPPVLLLRAFRDDQVAVRTGASHRDGWGFDPGHSRSFEEALDDLFGVCGPLVAIGRPGELVAPLGASRFWVRDACWQQAVDELIQESQLVVMIMGAIQGDDGLAWEVRRVFHLQQTSKLVLIMPPLQEELARQRWESFRPLCQGRLPPYRGGELAATFARDGTCAVARNSELGIYWSEADEEGYRSALLVESIDVRSNKVLQQTGGA